MDLTNLHVCPSDASMVAWYFCLFWPFLAMSSIPSRARSSAPLNAALVALAVIVCAIWVDLSNPFWAPKVFEIAPLAIWPLGWIAILSLVRRHRPTVDRTLVALAGLLCAVVIAALNFTTVVAPSVARTGAAIALVIALASAVRLFLVTRRTAT